MNKLEQKVASILLRNAADVLSNNGCNDFSLRKDAGLTDEESSRLIQSLNDYNSVHNSFGFEPEDLDSDIVMDWMLCYMLASKLEES